MVEAVDCKLQIGCQASDVRRQDESREAAPDASRLKPDAFFASPLARSNELQRERRP
jgi:hypothetical protein